MVKAKGGYVGIYKYCKCKDSKTNDSDESVRRI
jgi:hypothetical protein